MPQTILHLATAVITLYDAPPSGVAPSGVGIWHGSCPAGMKLTYAYDEVKSFPTGAPYGIVHHVNETHSIEIQKVAIVDDDVDGEFLPERDNFYAMKIDWVRNDGKGLRRTYYGLKAKSLDMSSRGVEEYEQNQAWSAQYFVSDKVS